MDRANRSSRSVRLKAQADRLAVDLILDCERAASRRGPRLCDPTRWSRTAWRRYLYAAAHAPCSAFLDADADLTVPNQSDKKPASLRKGRRAVFV